MANTPKEELSNTIVIAETLTYTSNVLERMLKDVGKTHPDEERRVNEEATPRDPRFGPATKIELDVVNPKQHIGLFGAVTFGIGSMIGSGIFISPKASLAFAGSQGMSLVIWSLCGLIAFMMGLVYAELGTIIPRSGGDFVYIRKGFGPVPAFLAVWVIPLFVQTSSTAVLALVFADYLLPLVYGSCPPPNVLRKLIGALLIITIAISNIVSPKFGVFVQMISTVAKTLALIIIAITGIVFILKGRTENLTNAFDGSASEVTSYSLAIYSCAFAYSGYIRIGEIADEIINPQKNIPRALMISITLVTVIYVVVNTSYFVLLPKPEFLGSPAVAYDWALKCIPSVAIFVPISVMISVYGSNNGGCFGSARVMFAAARAELYPEAISFLHAKDSTPIISLVLFHIICIIMLIPGDIQQLINFLSFMRSFVTLLSSLSLLRLKWLSRKEPKKTGFRTNIIFPIVTSLIAVFLIVAPFINSPRIEFLYSAAFVFGGYFLYFPFVHFDWKLPGTDRITVFLQLLCNSCPTEKID
ncbi:b(0,+)-type amino acid transporter 1-like [Dreissena polymorpha]|uniref:Amino acid transporter n=1 Tax=Dreissena polymorpha TaxID=45954 RepID=A0A9D4LGA6_DREPO|nr:b(0,+)-type amino acid transporter 1-like [Dreissena polymorpha]KAH3858023.1 hypothetical protein DPMN_100642 [Dreissena polymorpha]